MLQSHVPQFPHRRINDSVDKVRKGHRTASIGFPVASTAEAVTAEANAGSFSVVGGLPPSSSCIWLPSPPPPLLLLLLCFLLLLHFICAANGRLYARPSQGVAGASPTTHHWSRKCKQSMRRRMRAGFRVEDLGLGLGLNTRSPLSLY